MLTYSLRGTWCDVNPALHRVKYKANLYFIWFDISVSDSYVADVEAYVLFYRFVVPCTL